MAQKVIDVSAHIQVGIIRARCKELGLSVEAVCMQRHGRGPSALTLTERKELMGYLKAQVEARYAQMTLTRIAYPDRRSLDI
ncbi:MAG: hypothetical protein L0229_20410 [Blastocatellia bacterium]|nr:hypothetical protein [Blastocatellia bacterium]